MRNSLVVFLNESIRCKCKQQAVAFSGAGLKRTDLNSRGNQGDWFKFASSLSPGHSWTAAGMWPGRGARQAHSCSRPRSQAPGDLGKHTAATGRGLAEAPGNLGNLWFAAAQPPPAWPAILISSHLGAVICKVYCNLQQPPLNFP